MIQKNHLDKETRDFKKGNKKRHQGVALLQPPTLALFPAWGSSAGASRTPLPGAKVLRNCYFGNAD